MINNVHATRAEPLSSKQSLWRARPALVPALARTRCLKDGQVTGDSRDQLALFSRQAPLSHAYSGPKAESGRRMQKTETSLVAPSNLICFSEAAAVIVGSRLGLLPARLPGGLECSERPTTTKASWKHLSRSCHGPTLPVCWAREPELETLIQSHDQDVYTSTSATSATCYHVLPQAETQTSESKASWR